MKRTKQLHEKLIEQCKKNDRKSQLKLYNLYCNSMFIVAIRYIKNKVHAEDVLQEAFLKAFKNLNTFKGEVAFVTWLKKIVINQCIDTLKKKKIDLVLLEENSHEPIIEDDDNWNVASFVMAKQVIETINSLKEKYRLVLTLYLLEGYDHQEIAEILGITEVTSRTHLLRGKKLVQQQLKSIYEKK